MSPNRRQRLGGTRPDPAAEETAEGRAKEVFSPSSGGSPRLLHADLLTNMRTRRSWTREQKHQIVLDAVRSGMPIDRFARVSGLTPSVVHRWRQEMLVDVQQHQRSGMEPVSFAAVMVDPAQSQLPPPSPIVSSLDASDRVDILLTNGRRLTVNVDIEPRLLRRLVQALELPA